MLDMISTVESSVTIVYLGTSELIINKNLT